MKPSAPYCQIAGHNFMLGSVSSQTESGTKYDNVIFCTKCGETRPLQITESSNVGQAA